jgi:hypothetical protein
MLGKTKLMRRCRSCIFYSLFFLVFAFIVYGVIYHVATYMSHGEGGLSFSHFQSDGVEWSLMHENRSGKRRFITYSGATNYWNHLRIKYPHFSLADDLFSRLRLSC